MTGRDHGPLLSELAAEHERRSPTSSALNRSASGVLVDGGSHAIRLLRPFPPRIVTSTGGWIVDEDGHRILDFWQGHMANILGHNPEVVTDTLAKALTDGFGLQSGLVDRLQFEVAEILCGRIGADRVRLTTSGTLANLYAVMLARAFTGREHVMKVGGGWHGAQPWSLKGIRFAEGGAGFSNVDTDGLPSAMTDQVAVTAFNDPQRLTDDFDRFGDRLACFVVEPLIGAGGTIPATREYLATARELCDRYGVLLVLDEVITGFRFHAGTLGSLYDIRPDLTVLGKIIGGGMPVAAVAGRADVMSLLSRERGCRVNVSGGTYSAHPASMLAARTQLGHLVEHEDRIYPRLAELGTALRRAVEEGFAEGGVLARCTGVGPDLPGGSSLFMVHFPYNEETVIDTPEKVFDPAVCDQVLRDRVLGLALLLEDVHVVLAHGAASIAHTEDDMEHLERACRAVARRILQIG